MPVYHSSVILFNAMKGIPTYSSFPVAHASILKNKIDLLRIKKKQEDLMARLKAKIDVGKVEKIKRFLNMQTW